MALPNGKRKRDQDIHHDKVSSSQKRHRSNPAPSSSINPQPDQLSKSEARVTSRPKHSVITDAAPNATIDTQPDLHPLPIEDRKGIEADDEDEGDEESDDDSDTNSSEEEREQTDPTDSDGEPHPPLDDRKKKGELSKADNPSAFASSMAGILGYKLTRTQRANPILARSADAKEADETLLDRKLEKRAKAELKREEKLKKGGSANDDALGHEDIVANQHREKELRKMAQKGVVKMFNAFASVRVKTAEAQGLVGSRAKKEEKATEMSKEGWLEYVGQGGKSKAEKKGKD